jgi:hypothetical protein
MGDRKSEFRRYVPGVEIGSMRDIVETTACSYDGLTNVVPPVRIKQVLVRRLTEVFLVDRACHQPADIYSIQLR